MQTRGNFGCRPIYEHAPPALTTRAATRYVLGCRHAIAYPLPSGVVSSRISCGQAAVQFRNGWHGSDDIAVRFIQCLVFLAHQYADAAANVERIRRGLERTFTPGCHQRVAFLRLPWPREGVLR